MRSGAEVGAGTVGALVVSLMMTLALPTPGRSQEATVSTLDWLSGCWVAERATGSVQEVWMAPQGGVMVGMSRSVRGERATAYEFLLLRDVESGVVMWAYPSGQAPTDLPATSVTDAFLRVENPAHDFPQKIEYARISADSVTASVYGGAADTEPAFQLVYGRCEESGG